MEEIIGASIVPEGITESATTIIQSRTGRNQITGTDDFINLLYVTSAENITQTVSILKLSPKNSSGMYARQNAVGSGQGSEIKQVMP